MSDERVCAAVVQAAPEYLDLSRSIDKAIALIESAAREGARIVAFPELWLPGYPWWIWLAPPVWAMASGIDGEYRRNAFDYDSSAAENLRAAAQRHRIILSMALAERAHGSLYIGQWLVDESGQSIARRRKLKPGAAERALFGEGDRGDLRVDATSIGRVGALCCAEHRHPLFKYALYSQHEEVHIAAWPSFSIYQPFSPGQSPEVNLAISRVYAAEGGCYVLAPCAPVTEAMRARVCDTDDKGKLLPLGGGHAMAFGPHGNALCTPLDPTSEGILYCEMDPAQIRAAKAGYDAVGHSARPDAVKLEPDLGGRPARLARAPVEVSSEGPALPPMSDGWETVVDGDGR